MGNRLIIPTGLRYAPAPVPWNPAQVSPSAWWDASAVETISDTGGLVDQLSDISGNNNHLTATGSLRPTTNSRTQNSLNVLDFDGVGNSMKSTNFFSCSGGWQIFSVCKFDVVSGVNKILFQNGDGSGVGRSMFYSTTTGGTYFSSFIGGVALNFSASNTNVNNLSMSKVAGLGSTELTAWFDGVEGTSGDRVCEVNTNSPLLIGSNKAQNSLWLDGMIGEFVILAEVASEAIRQKVEGYLAWKWGLVASLPVGHPYKTVKPYVGD